MVSPKKSVAELNPYINGRHSNEVFEHSTRTMKLDSNESSVSPSPRVIAALTEFLQKSPLNWYPDVNSTELIKKLSLYTELPEEYIQTFNGSDHALETICRTFLEPDNEVIMCMPTYDHFRVYAQSCDAKIVSVFGKSPFIPKKEKLLQSLTDKTKIIYLVNPNNPTGMMYTREDVHTLLNAAPRAIVLVDEAYFEFCGYTMAKLVNDYNNLVITRSFSKAFGLAGLRCGYILSQSNNLESINKIRIGKNINSLAQKAACAALDDLEYMNRYVSEVQTAKQWLLEKLKEKGLSVVDTPANYILVEVSDPQNVQDYLEQNKIYIRDRSILPQLEGYIRISIGHMLLMERFWKIFQQIPSEYLIAHQPTQVVAKS